MRTGSKHEQLENIEKISQELERLKTMLKEHAKNISKDVFEKLNSQLSQSEKTFQDFIEFEKFKKDNKLFYDEKKEKWNKEFRPKIKTKWITDKRCWNKKEKKYGYFEDYQDGWEMGEIKDKSCMFCNKSLKEKQDKFCSDTHRKVFHKYLNEAKNEFDFTLSRGMIFIPPLYEHNMDKLGKWNQNKLKLERIEKKDIVFSIDGKQYTLTKKSRTV